MEKFTLKNQIDVVHKKNANTARVALSLYIDVNHIEKFPGVADLMSRLFFQGTKKRSAEELALELNENEIIINAETKSDFTRLKMLCLKEDFEHGLEILSDIFFNSTFLNLEKEITKYKGELEAVLDSPSAKAKDGFIKNLYPNHPYGVTESILLSSIENITKDEISAEYRHITEMAKKVFSVVGDIEKDELAELLEKYFAGLKNSDKTTEVKPPVLKKNIIKLEQQDANQAQIYQGWYVVGKEHPDAPALQLFDIILGSGGLSSRLFLELRDKKGLAYTVRSSYAQNRLGGHFAVYIGTEPGNIKISLDGFKKEIEKLKTVLAGEDELENAKNNIIGRFQYATETNLQQSTLYGFYEIENMGYNYLDTLIEKFKKVTPQDIMRVANEYFGEDYVLTVLAPKKFLTEV